MQEKKREQAISLVGVIALAILLPGILRLTNTVVRFFVGAEGRLAAIAVETNRVLGPMPAPWRGLAQGGENLKTFLDDSVAEVAILKPGYIRIDHVYDEFDVVTRVDGELKFDWAELDRTVTKIVQTGGLPFFLRRLGAGAAGRP